jgi:predicted heme/steroid binding protein
MKIIMLKSMLLAVVLLSWCFAAHATDEYALSTGKGCIFCHQESTGGQLQTAGFAYIRNGYRYPISNQVLQKAQTLQTPFHKTIRFIVGYLHLLAAVIFFGAIFYIHIFIKPARLTGGIPKAERILGLSCMITLTVTGVYLTWMRLDRWEQFFNNSFGLMLFVKILLFTLMVLTGLAAITVVHRRMKSASAVLSPQEHPTAESLHAFNGEDGRPAYFIHQNKIYDVTGNPKWKDGRHFGKHQAGTDLTQALAGAPHGAEVFERIVCLGEPAANAEKKKPGLSAKKVFVVMAYSNLVIIFLILGCISVWRWDFPLRLLPEKRAEAVIGQSCEGCHRLKTPAIYQDWEKSVHAKVGVHCSKCHRPNAQSLVLTSHLKHFSTPISVVVSPVNCGGCHPKEREAYDRSKHANTLEIMWKVDAWMNKGMNNEIERTTGCYACHGTLVDVVDGKPVEYTWPNVGVGRLNPDGSKGSCSSCHTRHRFSIVEARKPEACDQCHLGPDHPQIEIYNESKHGTLYHAEGSEWTWDPKTRDWQAGRDYRAPTCAACHMSAAGDVMATHDVTERLSWEAQAPRTVRPEDFTPFPAKTNWQAEREKMKTVCRQCHAASWAEAHFVNFDQVVDNYNRLYFDPVKSVMDQLYAAELLDETRYFDERLEVEYYEFWHHEGRRARMGAAMMAPDYAWWHGFYECKKRYGVFMEEARRLIRENRKAHITTDFPGAQGSTVRPEALFAEP